MVAIGRGLASSPKLLMLDEPSMGLAPDHRRFHLREAARDPARDEAHHPARRAARRRGAGVRRSRLRAGSRPRRARGQQREPARRRPRAAGVSRHVRQRNDLGDKRRDEQRKQRKEETMSKRSFVKLMLGGAVLPAQRRWRSAAPAQAQNPSEVKVGLLVPLSGIYARPGAVMRMGAEMAIERHQRAGRHQVAGRRQAQAGRARFRRHHGEGQERRAAHGGAGDRPGGRDRRSISAPSRSPSPR